MNSSHSEDVYQNDNSGYTYRGDQLFNALERRNSVDNGGLMTRDDFQLCEGLLSVFMRRGNNHKIKFKKPKNPSEENRLSQSAKTQREEVILDLGSIKQTISIEETSNQASSAYKLRSRGQSVSGFSNPVSRKTGTIV